MSKRAVDRAVLVAFVILAVQPFVFAAAHAWFWQPAHLLAPVAAAIYLVILGALVVGRYRWAWIVLAVFYAGVIVGWAFDSGRFTPQLMLGLVLNVLVLTLLLSTPMRDRLRKSLRPGGASKPVIQG